MHPSRMLPWPAVALAIAAPCHAAVYTATFAAWTGASGPTASGTLGSTGIAVSSAASLSIGSSSFTDPSAYAAPGTAASVAFSLNVPTTITFSAPVSDLALYAKFWSNGSYTLVARDASFNVVPFSFLSANSVPAISGSSFSVPSMLDGIIWFSGAVKSIEISPPGGAAEFTVAVVVPVPGVIASFVVGGRLMRGRRRSSG